MNPVHSKQREEYIARINRVVDHVETHLGAPLSLEQLAGVANFSPFHFHRIFRAMTGETLNAFIRRVRVERAAQQLVYQPGKPITEIALDCGFSGSAPFARAFREAFRMSATEWRRHSLNKSGETASTDRKIRQTMGNYGKAWKVQVQYLASVFGNQKWTIMIKNEIKAQVTVEEFPDLHVAYIRHVGPYQGDEQLFAGLFERLMRWAGPRGLIRFPETLMLSAYHNDPNVTEENKLMVSVCLTVPGNTEVEGEIGKMTIPGGNYAVARFELASDEYEAAWDAVFGGWLPESGYQPADGLSLEIYRNDPGQHPEGKHLVDICVPVKPL